MPPERGTPQDLLRHTLLMSTVLQLALSQTGEHPVLLDTRNLSASAKEQIAKPAVQIPRLE